MTSQIHYRNSMLNIIEVNSLMLGCIHFSFEILKVLYLKASKTRWHKPTNILFYFYYFILPSFLTFFQFKYLTWMRLEPWNSGLSVQSLASLPQRSLHVYHLLITKKWGNLLCEPLVGRGIVYYLDLGLS